VEEKEIEATRCHIGLLCLLIFTNLLKVRQEQVFLLLGDAGVRRDSKKRIAFSNPSDIMRYVFWLK
jgi:hypothetical protein